MDNPTFQGRFKANRQADFRKPERLREMGQAGLYCLTNQQTRRSACGYCEARYPFRKKLWITRLSKTGAGKLRGEVFRPSPAQTWKRF
ncbi:MAG: hypothetical protein ACTTJV_02590 [Ottowia sp.]